MLLVEACVDDGSKAAFPSFVYETSKTPENISNPQYMDPRKLTPRYGKAPYLFLEAQVRNPIIILPTSTPKAGKK